MTPRLWIMASHWIKLPFSMQNLISVYQAETEDEALRLHYAEGDRKFPGHERYGTPQIEDMTATALGFARNHARATDGQTP